MPRTVIALNSFWGLRFGGVVLAESRYMHDSTYLLLTCWDNTTPGGGENVSRGMVGPTGHGRRFKLPPIPLYGG